MRQPCIFNIQKYCIHDGNGIRTTLFFKGCPLSCLWCHNPESQRFGPELMYYHERCTACGTCISVCPQQANSFENGPVLVDRSRCTACGVCSDFCVAGAREVTGKTYSLSELIHEAEKDRMFYEESGGGITLSGGEVMVQDMDFLEEFLRRLYRKGYSINIDTCGYAPYENFQRVLPYTDTFLYDIKLMDPNKHLTYIGADNRLILENLIRLNEDGARINIRIPVIEGVNATSVFLEEVIHFLRNHKIRTTGINLLPYHHTGQSKYENLDRSFERSGMGVPTPQTMELLQDMLKQSGFSKTRIGG